MRFPAILFNAQKVVDGFTSQDWYKCGCFCALSVKTYADKVEVALAGHWTTYRLQPYTQQQHFVSQAKEYCEEHCQSLSTFGWQQCFSSESICAVNLYL
jgi:hypothetical protein